ncbi:substrate-binding domain-containing protein [Streptomyces sp. NPDC003758]
MTTHLLSSGRRRVSCPGRVQRLSTSAQRISGLCHDPALTVDGLFFRSSGYQAVRRLLASRAGFGAVVAATDIVAAGAIQALREEGIQVPDDVTTAGYDDITTALDVYPALTTVHVPHEELGRAAVGLALHREEFPETGTSSSAHMSSSGTPPGPRPMTCPACARRAESWIDG